MIKIVLRDNQRTILREIEFEGNDVVLLGRDPQAFPVLSNLDLNSYDVFDRHDASDIILEVRAARKEVSSSEMRDHLDDLIKLLLRAMNIEGSTVTFTPF